MKQPRHNLQADQSGAALLLTLLMLSLLIVLVGQFSYTVLIDRKVAINYMHDAQVSLDIFAGVGAAAVQISQAGLQGEQGEAAAQAEMQLESEDTQVSTLVEEEDAKFNVNILLEPPDGISQDEAQAALERLLKSVDEPEGTLPEGLAGNIAQYLHDKGSPALTLKELVNVQGVTEELLYGQAQSGLEGEFVGLSKYLTVWSDGLIDYNTADDKVLLSLVEGLNQNMLQMVLQFMEEPPQNLPPHIKAQVSRMQRFTKPDGSTFSAIVHSQSGNYAKKCMAVLRRGQGGASVILWDELEP
jgi:hypothetical protein